MSAELADRLRDPVERDAQARADAFDARLQLYSAVLAAHRDGYGVRAIARASGLPVTTVHRILGSTRTPRPTPSA